MLLSVTSSDSKHTLVVASYVVKEILLMVGVSQCLILSSTHTQKRVVGGEKRNEGN